MPSRALSTRSSLADCRIVPPWNLPEPRTFSWPSSKTRRTDDAEEIRNRRGIFARASSGAEYSRQHRAAPFAASLERSFSAFEFGSAKNDVMTDTLATEGQVVPRLVSRAPKLALLGGTFASRGLKARSQAGHTTASRRNIQTSEKHLPTGAVHIRRPRHRSGHWDNKGCGGGRFVKAS
jgi:hypothetical protein